MLADALRLLYAYSNQSNNQIFAAADSLPAEQLTQPAPDEQRSLRDTLVHIVSVQQSWLQWWDGSLPGEEAYRWSLDPEAYRDVASIRAEWEGVHRQTEAFLATLRDEDMSRIYSNTLPDGSEVRMVLWQMMLHVANHGTQHRSEAAAMLTAFGHSPGGLDLLWFLMTQPAS